MKNVFKADIVKPFVIYSCLWYDFWGPDPLYFWNIIKMIKNMILLMKSQLTTLLQFSHHLQCLFKTCVRFIQVKLTKISFYWNISLFRIPIYSWFSLFRIPVYSWFILFRIPVYSWFSLFRIPVYLWFSLFQIPVYSWFSLFRIPVYSWFSLFRIPVYSGCS